MESMTVAQRRREREKLARREKILDAAQRAFASRGVALATMDDVAAEAELSKGTLYLYFKSKDELFLECMLRKQGEILARFDELAQQDLSGLDLVREMARTYAQFAERHPSQFRTAVTFFAGGFQIDPSAANFAAYRERIATLAMRMVSAIERGQHDGSIDLAVVPRRFASQLWAGMLGVMLINSNASDHTLGPPEGVVDITDLVPSFIERLIGSIKAPNRGDDRESGDPS